MSNELNNIISQNTDGVYEGVAIGGDRYPGTSFIDHLLRYQAEPECKILLLLGEVGGVKDESMREAGFFVPETFEKMPAMLAKVYQKLVKEGTIKPAPEPVVPKIP